jgi:hypothetical protein
VTLPTVDSGANYAVAGSMSGIFGFLKRSVDGQYLTIAGVNVPAGTQGSVFGNSTYPNRAIARVDASGVIDSSTRFDAAGITPRSAIPTNGTDIWWSGDSGSGGLAGGIRYLTLGSTTSGVALGQGNSSSPTTVGQPVPVPSSARVLNIHDNQLYGSSNATVGSGTSAVSMDGVFNVGVGLPTTANQFGSRLVSSGASTTFDFYFADTSTLYIANDGTLDGISKWSLSGSTWNRHWTALPAGAAGVRGLAGVTDLSSGTVELYGVTAAASGVQNELVRLVDTLSGTAAPSYTVLATAPSNYLFRGVALSPVSVPEPSSAAMLVGGGLALAAISRRGWRRS